jgi:tetratricopeptide (TPR) repeat protein
VKRIIFFLLSLWAWQFSYCHAQWIEDSLSDAHIQKGIQFVYNLSFDSARVEFSAVAKTYPDHPAGHFFLAMVDWWKIVIDIDNKSHDKKFIQVLDRVIDLCDKRLDENENDITGLFFKGGALGFQGRLYGNREDWLKAANCGREALPVVMKANELAPNNNDVLLGTGIYNYYASVIPDIYPWVKPLMFFLPKGDKTKGISQLNQASSNARYANIEAKYFLVQVFHNFEKRYQEASDIAGQLHNQFPNNVLFHKYVGRAFASLSNWKKVIETYNDILVRHSLKITGYESYCEREAHFFLGTAMLETGKLDTALIHFYRSDELSRALDKKGSSSTMVFTNLRIGMIYDLQGKHELALIQYRKVLDMNEYNDSQKFAKQYINTPYQR